LARQPRGNPKAHQPTLAGAGIYQKVGWLNVLVDDAALMQLIDASHLHGFRGSVRPPQGPLLLDR
jgi:hypothetical protein